MERRRVFTWLPAAPKIHAWWVFTFVIGSPLRACCPLAAYLAPALSSRELMTKLLLMLIGKTFGLVRSPNSRCRTVVWQLQVPPHESLFSSSCFVLLWNRPIFAKPNVSAQHRSLFPVFPLGIKVSQERQLSSASCFSAHVVEAETFLHEEPLSSGF